MRCGALRYVAVRCGAVRCGAVRLKPVKTAPHRSQPLDFNDPKGVLTVFISVRVEQCGLVRIFVRISYGAVRRCVFLLFEKPPVPAVFVKGNMVGCAVW